MSHMEVLYEVQAERQRQDDIWGEQNHDPFGWIAILGEEYGEVCKDALKMYFGGAESGKPVHHTRIKLYREELIQVAAVAVAAVESLDRNGYA